MREPAAIFSGGFTPMLIGYARVSTYGQTLEAQLAQLKAQGCSKYLFVARTGRPLRDVITT
jgi:Resolvase, N terminal domain